MLPEKKFHADARTLSTNREIIACKAVPELLEQRQAKTRALKQGTPARLRKGTCRPCSRNPMIAQTLATLSLMEQRGTGFARMRDAMLDHGLKEAEISQQDGFFIVTLPGPAGDYDRIRAPENAGGLVTPAVEAQLNERQKRMVAMMAAGERLTSRRCEEEFGVTRDTATRDFAHLLKLGIAEKSGRGRSVGYELINPT